MSEKIAPAAKRIFMPRRSPGARIARFELEISRKPFSPQATGTTSRVASTLNRSSPTSPPVSASKAAGLGIRKGSENRFISRICGDRLIVDDTVMSITPWRIATSSRVWSPPTSCDPG